MEEIQHTLVEALILVIIVVFIFLQGWRATLIPLLAVPVSLVGTFALFPLFGFTMNTLSLFGLVLAIGLVVDDAIVVVEAVEHHIEHGLSPKEATFKAMEEVSGPVIGIALVLSAVFIPTAFIPGITGTIISAVRRDHRGLGAHLRLQRAHAFARAFGAALASRRKRAHGLLQRFFDWFNRVFGAATERLRERLPRPDPQDRSSRSSCSSASSFSRDASASASPRASCPRKIRATCSPGHLARRRVAAAHR